VLLIPKPKPRTLNPELCALYSTQQNILRRSEL